MNRDSRVCDSCASPLPPDAAFCPACGEATPTGTIIEEPIDEERLRAALIDRYLIERELGRGGMAAVYLAQDVRHDRYVAVKVMLPKLTATIGAQRFLREIRIAAKLNHPHILDLYESGEAAGLLYYIMPYVDGESLRDRLRRERQLPIDDALSIARQVAEALQYAHKAGVIHRDIKPGNVLIASGQARISDFGVAKAVSLAGGAAITSIGTSVGTPLYMSPEQTAGDPNIDGRSDIYSLGCVLYEALTGEPPFVGPTVQAVIAKHAMDPRPDVRTLRDTVPIGVQIAIQRAMAKVPADRFSTAAEFAAVLSPSSPAIEGAPRDRGVPPPSRTRGEVRRRRLRAAFVTGLLAVTVVAVALVAPAISARLSGRGAATYSDSPVWPPWTELSGEHFPVVAATDSTLVIHRFGSDSLFTFDGRRWVGLAVPDSFSLRPYNGVIGGAGLLATKNRIDRDGNRLIQYWRLTLADTRLDPAEALGEYEPDLVRSLWWSDGREVVTWLPSITRLTPSGWLPEPTGTPGQIIKMWGRDIRRRFAIAGKPRDSLLVYDGISWRLEDALPAGSSERAWYAGGTTLPDGATVVFGETCSVDARCAPLLLQQDQFGGAWRRIMVPPGRGMPTEQPRAASDTCLGNRFVLYGAAGRHRRDYYVWGDWTSCRQSPPRGVAGCPAGQPCLWQIADRTLRPVEDLTGKLIVQVTSTDEAVYALIDDGAVWRRVDGAWRFVGKVPDLPHRLVGAAPGVVARATGATVTYEPGIPDTLSPFFVTPFTDLPDGVSDATPPRRLLARDTLLGLLTAGGRAHVSRCAKVPIAVGSGGAQLRCGDWVPLEPEPGPLTDIAVLSDGRLIGVGAQGLVVIFGDRGPRRERIPVEAQGDSLWGLHVSADGVVTAVGTAVVLERDTLGVWTVVRRLTGDAGIGDHFVALPNGDVVVAGSWMRVWDRSDRSTPVATLHRRVLGEANVSALVALPDGRLVAGFANPGRSGVGGWLQVWASPAREGRWVRVDVPMTVNVTDLATDGQFLHVVGRGGSMAIPLDSLPFAGEAASP